MHIFRQTNFPLLLLIPSISTPVCTNSLNLSYNTAPTVSIPCHWTSQFIVPLTDSGRIAVLWESTGKCPFWKSKPQPGIAVVGLWYHHSFAPVSSRIRMICSRPATALWSCSRAFSPASPSTTAQPWSFTPTLVTKILVEGPTTFYKRSLISVYDCQLLTFCFWSKKGRK